MARNTGGHSEKIEEASMEEEAKETLKRPVKLYKDDWKIIEEDNFKELADTLTKKNNEESNLNHNFGHRLGQASLCSVNFANKKAKILHSSPPAQGKGKSPEFTTRSNFLKDKDMEDRVHEGVSNSSRFDIASSVDAEVKVSLICNSSGNSYFRQRCLDAVLEVVEDECRKTYGIKNPDFSLVKLMEKVCQFFLEMENGSSCETGIKICDKSKQSEGKDAVTDDNEDNSAMEPNKVLQDPQSLETRMMEGVLQKNYPIYLKDISRGEDNIPIPLVNESSTLELPDFIYIKNNMVYQDGHVDFSLARISEENCCAQCLGDCLSSDLPCACAAETGGEFVYTQKGLLKEEFLDEAISVSSDPQRKHFYYCEICPLQNEPQQRYGKIKRCKGHLTRKFIKECWSKCGCSKKCGNRVVQRGIQVALQIYAAPEGKGWGVRSANALKKGTFICEYVGEIVTNQELYERNIERAAKKERHTYPVLLDADWGSERILEDEEALCLDATEFGNIGRFINHRCHDSNLIEIPVEVETPDHHYYRLAFFTTRDTEPMEELTWDYGIQFDDKYHPIKAFKCKCGSMGCRDKQRRH
ncbi:hypothetical protein SADUNF_Sadunf09G0112700 [Salix dunnii]|uniref:Uncharacterized protein n=1 Tax=Salix dunnii TaxID=1413687 RepID=A0A835MRH1_9ROSI|nr:hypothetical protein SADUNF_Sadunf09G0112700 [Salix dunnii]